MVKTIIPKKILKKTKRKILRKPRKNIVTEPQKYILRKSHKYILRNTHNNISRESHENISSKSCHNILKKSNNISREPYNISNESNNILKNPRKINLNNYFSASKIKNFMFNDPLIDWLTIYKKDEKTNDTKFVNNLLSEGLKFENEIINKISKKHKIVKVCNKNDYYNYLKIYETKNLINKGENIIYQGMLINSKNKTYGIPDLIIRSDYINKIFNNTLSKEDELINNKYYYIIVDIKNSTINLNSNGEYILNSDNLIYYKAQLLIYTMALSEITKTKIDKAFILGKKYIWKKNKNLNIAESLSRLALIDYKNNDKNYYDFVKSSLSWLNNLKYNGHKWVLLPKPSINELYPNMKNKHADIWKKYKLQIAEEINELTLIWNISYKNRLIAHQNNIFDWKDLKCNTTNLEINGKRALIIDNMLKINRNNTDLIITGDCNISRSTRRHTFSKKINYNLNNWKYIQDNEFEFYIDYETTFNNNINYIFMIGVGFIENNKWIFKNFYLEVLDDKSQLDLLNNFWIFINEILLKHNKIKSRFIHWTKAEPANYKKLFKKYNLPIKNFIDLYDVFINEPIIIKGAFSFGLKDISKALYNLNFISSSWTVDSLCSNGLDALYWSQMYYESNNKKEKCKIIKDIINYNEIDCKVLYEIILFLRNEFI